MQYPVIYSILQMATFNLYKLSEGYMMWEVLATNCRLTVPFRFALSSSSHTLDVGELPVRHCAGLHGVLSPIKRCNHEHIPENGAILGLI